MISYNGLAMVKVSLIALVMGGSLCGARESLLNRGKPNVILLVTDDQGYADLGCHGHPVLKTPNLDRLRGESLSFDSFHASPTCAPTRAAIMSGRDPFYVGVTHTILERERMALGVPTLAEMMRDNGYSTGMFGKWHLGDGAAYRPDRRGFDEVFMHGAGGIGHSFPGSSGDAPWNKYFDPFVLHNNRFVKTKGFCTDVFFDRAIGWMKEVKDTGKPFFTYLATNAPHGPFICSSRYKVPFGKVGYTDKQQGFYGMIGNIDERVGGLLAQLDEWGIARDTLFIFMSDNGPNVAGNAWNAGMKGKKGSLHEGGTRVPFFIRWPGKIKGGGRCDRLVRHYDLLPTLAAITGAAIKEEDKLAGRSFVGLLEDPGAGLEVWPDRLSVFHGGRWGYMREPTRDKGFALRSERWRLVGKRLYDVRKDPLQKKDVAGDHPEVVRGMMEHYYAWWEGALPLMVNEKVKLEGHNAFHLLFWKQYGIAVPALGR